MKLFRRIRYNAPFTITFVLISFIALLVNGRTNGAANRLLFSVYRSDLRDPLTYIRAFTHVLGHSSFTHYSGNIMLMLVLGPTLEERYGSATIFYLSALTALDSGHSALSTLTKRNAIRCKQPGICDPTKFSRRRTRQLDPVNANPSGHLYIGGETVTGMISRDDISQLSHIIGGVCGAAFGDGTEGRRR